MGQAICAFEFSRALMLPRHVSIRQTSTQVLRPPCSFHSWATAGPVLKGSRRFLEPQKVTRVMCQSARASKCTLRDNVSHNKTEKSLTPPPSYSGFNCVVAVRSRGATTARVERAFAVGSNNLGQLASVRCGRIQLTTPVRVRFYDENDASSEQSGRSVPAPGSPESNGRSLAAFGQGSRRH